MADDDDARNAFGVSRSRTLCSFLKSHVLRVSHFLGRFVLSEIPPVFDPDFDDSRWTLDWAATPIVSVPVGSLPDGYEVVERLMTRAQVFDRIYEASEPFPVRALLDPSGGIWMSDTPQERMMMYNNAMVSRGRILVGGLGLAMYPQYAASRAERFTIYEKSRAVAAAVTPVLDTALTDREIAIPCDVIVADVEGCLAAEPTTLYDTIFLDTWDTLDVMDLPHINRLRDLAIRHLAPGGRVLLWGYRWMLRLFEDACRQLLSVPPHERQAWLAGHDPTRTAPLLRVLAHFGGRAVDDMDAAMAWCRAHVAELP